MSGRINKVPSKRRSQNIVIRPIMKKEIDFERLAEALLDLAESMSSEEHKEILPTRKNMSV
jgi:hypothetical protein